MPSPQDAEKFRREKMDRLSAGTSTALPEYEEPDRRPLSVRLSEMRWRNVNLAFGYALGLGQDTTKWLYGDNISVDKVISEAPQNAIVTLGLLAKGTSLLNACSAENRFALAWAKQDQARVALFKENTALANSATGTSNQLGQIGVELAQPLYGGAGMQTEVMVEVGRRMDLAPPMPLNTAAEWEVKLVQLQNLASSSRVASEMSRDIARAQRYGANAEIGWISWRGFPAGMADELEAGGVIAVDAPLFVKQLSPH